MSEQHSIETKKGEHDEEEGEVHEIEEIHNETENYEDLEKKELHAKKEELVFSEDAIHDVLAGIGLSSSEYKVYIQCSGKGPISIGEISLLVSNPVIETEEIAQTLVDKGLFKEITGAIHYYEALPPYAAIIDQMVKFDDYLTKMNQKLPIDLVEKFETIKESSKGIKTLGDFKEDLNQTIQAASTSLESQRTKLEAGLHQLAEQTKVVSQISSLRDNSINMVNKELEALQQDFDFIQAKISRNLEKLHLGIITKTVKSVISDILENELEKINKNLETRFVAGFKLIINALINKIQEIPKQIDDVSSHVRKVFEDTKHEFSESLKEAQSNMVGVSDQISETFDDLRDNFSENIIKALSELMVSLNEKIEVNNNAILEFWAQARKKAAFSMKDVWFIRSPEGMKAQINEALRNTKMRMLIVAPTLSDLDLDPLLKSPSHLQIRLSCFIDPLNREHQKIIAQLEDHPHIQYRNRELQNLWGMHKDYEEVVIGIVSLKVTEKGEKKEVVGIGSIIEEHIKIFIPILEDAWVGASKNIPTFKKTSIPISESKAKKESGISKELAIEKENKKDTISQKKGEISEPKTIKSKLIPPKIEVDKIPAITTPTPPDKIPSSETKEVEKPKDEPEIIEDEIESDEKIEKEISAPQKEELKDKELGVEIDEITSDEDLQLPLSQEDLIKAERMAKKIFFLEKQLPDLSIIQIANNLRDIYKTIEEQLGHRKIIKYMKKWEEELRETPLLDRKLQGELSGVLKSWIKQLKGGN